MIAYLLSLITVIIHHQSKNSKFHVCGIFSDAVEFSLDELSISNFNLLIFFKKNNAKLI